VPDHEHDHHPTHAETVSDSRLLREWSRSLQHWSQGARQRAEVTLGSGPSPLVGRAAQPRVEPPSDQVELADVSVVDLFVILVESHRLEVRDAVRRLTLGLLTAGYPGDSERVSASDALDILQAVLDQDG
jgi:hypothetical protein